MRAFQHFYIIYESLDRYDLLNSFEHCRAYRFYKFKGGRYNLKRAGKPLHVRINFKINFK